MKVESGKELIKKNLLERFSNDNSDNIETIKEDLIELNSDKVETIKEDLIVLDENEITKNKK